MAKVFAIANQKGGVGKTTTCINLAASLVATKRRVLLIDLDPQGNATMGSGVDKHALENSIYDVLIGECDLAQAMHFSEHGGYQLLPANRDLTAVRNPDEMVSRHLLDSLSILPHLALADSWLDVGSGGGMPGIPLAIMFPEKRIATLDSTGTKTRFQTQVKLELGLANLQVIHSRAETFVPEQPFAGIVSRAFSSLHDFAHWTRHLGNGDTRWLAMKGLHPADELVALPADFHLDSEHALAVPGCQGQRHLLILRRTA